MRVHGTTERVVVEHYAQEQPRLKPLPAVRFDAVLSLQRRISHEGCVSVGGNLYSVLHGTRKRMVDVETTPNQVRILEDGTLFAVHTLLHGRRQRSLLPGHRSPRRTRVVERAGVKVPAGHTVSRRSLVLYEQIARHLASAQ